MHMLWIKKLPALYHCDGIKLVKTHGIIWSFLHKFLQCDFFWYFVGNGTSNASQLSRNKIQEEGGAGGTCNCIIILLFFFTTKLSNEIVEHFYLIKQI